MQKHTVSLFLMRKQKKKSVISRYHDTESLGYKKTFYTAAHLQPRKFLDSPKARAEV